MVKYILFFFSLAFDYSGIDEGGSVIQLSFILLAFLSGFYIIHNVSLPLNINRAYSSISKILIIHLVATALFSLLQGVEVGRYLRISLPYYLLVLGYFVGVRAVNQIGVVKTINLVIFATVTASIFTVIYGLQTGDFSNNGIRYQVLSASLFVLVPILAHKLFLAKERLLLVSTAMLVILVLIIISATRSWLIAYIGIVLFTISLVSVRSIRGLIRGGLRGLFICSLLATLLFGVLAIVMPDAVSRMGDRIFSSQDIGFDMTAATRIAEMDYQINALLSDVTSFLVGQGLGASYGFSGSALEQLIGLFGSEQENTDWWFAGHNFWVYSLFTQGILLGWIIPFALICGLHISWSVIKSSHSIPILLAPIAISTSRLCLIVIVSILLSTIGGNPLGSRFLGLLIGVFLSISIAMPALSHIRQRALN